MISPKNAELYELAFFHRSASYVLNDGTHVNNERLEYLGDAIIDAIVADFLFCRFPKEKEGFLSKMRARIVNRDHLDGVATSMGLYEILITQKNTTKKRICGDALEAMIGAMYLDQGYENTRAYLIDYVFFNFIDLESLLQTENDFKSRFLEWGQKYRLQITFKMAPESINAKEFAVQAMVNGIPMSRGTGLSKKNAEQDASRNALSYIQSSDFSIKDFLNFLTRKVNTSSV
ncbi:MAG: ribonuclease III [Bacteroidales bacterium]|nr:ribonuclease III [Bacteroidales bacterium]